MSSRPTILERLRRPEYTGENRCLPCTIINVGLALMASAVAAVVTRGLGTRVSSRPRSLGRAVAAATFGGSLLAIYLRGYLVPGTPALTKRYLPDRVLAAFDKESPRPRTGIEIEPTGESEPTASESDPAAADEPAYVEELERHREQAVEPEQFLLEADAVELCENGADLCLTDGFDARVTDELESARGSTADEVSIADLCGIDPDAVTDEDRGYPAFKIGRRVHKWPADAALLADVAVHRALLEQTDRWRDVPAGQRLAVLEVMRSFLEACPDCGGSIRLTDGTVESCCRSYEVLALECADCGAPLLEFDPTELGGEDGGIEP